MNDASVTLLIANNGLGHARRALAILGNMLLISPSLHITVALSNHTYRRLPDLGELADPVSAGRTVVRIVKGGIGWPVSNDLHERSQEWIEDISRLDEVWNADLVVSDNYTEVLAIRADTVLMGSFLWSDVLASVPCRAAAALSAQERELLTTHRPTMLCVGELATPGVLNHTRAVGLPYMCPPLSAGQLLHAGKRRRGVGLTVGTTIAAVSLAESYIPVLSQDYPVFVDPALADLLTAEVRALVSVISARRLPHEVEVLICRPGMGAISDALDACVPIVVFAERGQAEMEHLIHRLPALGLAASADIEPSGPKLLDVVRLVRAEPTYSRIRDRLAECERGGTTAAAQWFIAELERRRVSLG